MQVDVGKKYKIRQRQVAVSRSKWKQVDVGRCTQKQVDANRTRYTQVNIDTASKASKHHHHHIKIKFFFNVFVNKPLEKKTILKRQSDLFVLRLIFWSDWGQTPHIARSSLDVLDAIYIVSTNLHWPNGITIDHQSNHLYWIDGRLGR